MAPLLIHPGRYGGGWLLRGVAHRNIVVLLAHRHAGRLGFAAGPSIREWRMASPSRRNGPVRERSLKGCSVGHLNVLVLFAHRHAGRVAFGAIPPPGHFFRASDQGFVLLILACSPSATLLSGMRRGRRWHHNGGLRLWERLGAGVLGVGCGYRLRDRSANCAGFVSGSRGTTSRNQLTCPRIKAVGHGHHRFGGSKPPDLGIMLDGIIEIGNFVVPRVVEVEGQQLYQRHPSKVSALVEEHDRKLPFGDTGSTILEAGRPADDLADLSVPGITPRGSCHDSPVACLGGRLWAMGRWMEY